MINKVTVSLNSNDVFEPGTMFWYEEGDYVKLVQSPPSREVILTKAGRSIWHLVAGGNLIAQEIVEKLQDRFSEELVIANLEAMVNMGLITTKTNFLWQEE